MRQRDREDKKRDRIARGVAIPEDLEWQAEQIAESVKVAKERVAESERPPPQLSMAKGLIANWDPSLVPKVYNNSGY